MFANNFSFFLTTLASSPGNCMLFIAFKVDCTVWTNPLLIQILAPCLAAPTMQKKMHGFASSWYAWNYMEACFSPS